MEHAHTTGRTRTLASIRALLTPVLILSALMLTLPAFALGAVSSAPTPSNTAAPTLTGAPVPGQTLTCSPGTWTNNPTGYAYTWLRDGAPVAGQTAATYVVQPADQGHSLSCKVTANNEGGDYTISSLSSGSYKVSFTREGEGAGNYLKQFFNGKATFGEADSVSVTAPNATGAINAELHAGGQIAGRVIDAVTKAPIAGVFVCAEQTGSKPEFGGCEVTNGNGEYAIQGLPTASYDVVFYSFLLTTSYRTQFYNGKSSYLEADSVAVTTGASTSGINAELRPYNEGSAIEGVVTEAKLPHLPVGRIEVCASPANEGVIGECATTNAAGEYKITGLGEGEYVVTFSGESCTSGGCVAPNYIRQYYSGKYASEKATPVILKAHETATLINAEMLEGGSIKGTVTDATTHASLANITACTGAIVEVKGEQGFFEDCAPTNGAGEYTLSGLPKETYMVHFFRSANYLEAVASIHVEVGATATLNAELHSGGQITGRVTSAATHAPVEGVGVCAKGASTTCATTSASGEYTLSRLQTGTYEVSYYVEENEKLNYLPQTRGGVTVTQGETTSGINAELSPGGQIMGRVTDAATHAGVTHISVCAEEIGGGKAFQCASTTAGGVSASATSNALVAPAPNSTFKLAKKPVFNAKTGNLEFIFVVSNAGTFRWSLFFKNADVGFADSLGISLGQSAFSGEGVAVAEAAKKKGKGHKAKKCKSGFVKHNGKCKRKLVPFSSGSQSVAAGTVLVKVHASAAALKGLKKAHTLHVSGAFTFQSALGGAPTRRTVQATIHPPKKHGRKRGKRTKK